MISVKRAWVQVLIWVLAWFESRPVGSSPYLSYTVSIPPFSALVHAVFTDRSILHSPDDLRSEGLSSLGVLSFQFKVWISEAWDLDTGLRLLQSMVLARVCQGEWESKVRRNPLVLFYQCYFIKIIFPSSFKWSLFLSQHFYFILGYKSLKMRQKISPHAKLKHCDYHWKPFYSHKFKWDSE